LDGGGTDGTGSPGGLGAIPAPIMNHANGDASDQRENTDLYILRKPSCVTMRKFIAACVPIIKEGTPKTYP
jgi:hypothetical protein